MSNTAENQGDSNKLEVAQSFNLQGKVPNLQSAQILPVDLTSEYWTPTEDGESKRCFFQDIKDSVYVDETSGESIVLPCVIFVEQDKDGNLKTFRNGSKRFVASMESALKSHQIVQGTPLLIQYLGKRKNSTNAFKSDTWSIRPLIVLDDNEKFERIKELFNDKRDYVKDEDVPHIEKIIKDKKVMDYDKALAGLNAIEIPKE